jgi:hypothetical protein
LNKKLIANSNNLDVLADDVTEKENTIAHLADQREALVENYVKA